MAGITDPLAVLTRGIVKTGGATDPLGMTTYGWIVVDGVVVPVPTRGRGRRTYFTMIGRTRLGR